MSERCGYAVTDSEGIEGPCDRPATSWRWYEDCGHEELLEAACVWHENASGIKIRALVARLASVKVLAEDWQANGNSRELGDPRADVWHKCAEQLLAVLGSDAHTEQKGAGE